jgi:aryl-alcohol dehydrogenase-like predicted oxidoreductase
MMNTNPAIPDFLAANQLGGVLRGVFNGGRLSGKYFHQPPEFSPDDIRSTRMSEKDRMDFLRYAAFEEMLTEERGMVQLALRYLLDAPTTTSIIPGGKSFENYREAARATELPPLTNAERTRIAELRGQILAE